jgi:predicted small secreted protein
MRASDMSSVTARSRVRRACRTGSGAGGSVRPAAGGAAGCAPWCRRPRSVARPDEDVGVGVLDLDDETLELEPAKVVAAAALGVGGGVGSEQPGDEDCWPSRNASLGRPSSTCVDSSRTRRLAAQFDVLVATTLSACNGTEFIGGKDFSPPTNATLGRARMEQGARSPVGLTGKIDQNVTEWLVAANCTIKPTVRRARPRLVLEYQPGAVL